MANALFKAAGKLFEKETVTTKALTGMFNNVETLETTSVTIPDTATVIEAAVDIPRNTGERLNSYNTFGEKEYEMPFFKEGSRYTDEMLYKRMAGQFEYASAPSRAKVIDMVKKDLMKNSEKIAVGIEKMCGEMLELGKVTLIDGTVIDTGRDTDLAFTSASVDKVWSDATAKPDIALAAACKLIREKSDTNPALFDAIMSDTSLYEFLNLLSVANSKYRMDTLSLADIQGPTMNTTGMSYHGTLSAASFKINIWSYPQTYTVASGFGLSNEGTKQPYFTDGKVIVKPAIQNVDFRMYYAATGSILEQVDRSLTGFGIQTGRFQPYGYKDMKNESFVMGVKAAPLPIPVQKDAIAVITT